MLVRKAVAAASITTLMTAGLGIATAAPASAAPRATTLISAQELRSVLGNLRNIDLVVVNLDGATLVEVDVRNLTVVALNNIIINALNDLTVTIQDIDINIQDNVLIVNVDVL